MTKADLYQDVTDSIIEALEKGVSPWVCPWRCDGGAMPFNFSTGDHYSGINVILLYLATLNNRYSNNAWLTYKQAQIMGGQVKKGSKSVRCIFYKRIEIEDDQSDTTQVVPMIRPFSLFNLDQIDGLKLSVAEDETGAMFTPIERAELLMKASGAKIEVMGDQAFYTPSKDMIVLPERTRFNRAEDFYATATHELTHWTGHKSRLDRGYKGIRGENSYAFEELVAEIGSAYINADLGLAGDLQHANYIEYWLDLMKADKRAIFKAASQASKAHQYIVDKLVQADKNKVTA